MKIFFLFLTFLNFTGLAFSQTPERKSLAERVQKRFEKEAAKEDPETKEDPGTKAPEPEVAPDSVSPAPEPGTEPGPEPTPTPEPEPTPTPEPEPTPTPEPEPTPIPEPEPTPIPEPEPTPTPEPEPTPTPEPAPTPPIVPDKGGPLPEFGPDTESYKIKSGDTLGRVASRLYGSLIYATILQDYNKVDPRRLRIGQELKTPSLAAFVREMAPKLLEAYPAEMRLLLETQQEFSALEALLKAEGLNDLHIATIAGLQTKLDQVTAGLSVPKEEVSGSSSKTLSHIKNIHKSLEGLKKGTYTVRSKSGKACNTRFAQALTEAIKWGKD